VLAATALQLISPESLMSYLLKKNVSAIADLIQTQTSELSPKKQIF
jgi:hypothetical protein